MIKDNLYILIGELIILLASLAFGIVGLVTDQWSSTFQSSLLDMEDDPDLWQIGSAVLVILGCICICLALVVLFARFFGQGRGKILLAAVNSLIAAAVFIVALGIFLGQNAVDKTDPDATVTYGYTFGLLWAAVPLLITGSGFFFTFKDDAFLGGDSEYEAQT